MNYAVKKIAQVITRIKTIWGRWLKRTHENGFSVVQNARVLGQQSTNNTNNYINPKFHIYFEPKRW